MSTTRANRRAFLCPIAKAPRSFVFVWRITKEFEERKLGNHSSATEADDA
jgi:hypothetical protein